MSEKMFETRMDDVFEGIINITRNGENFVWFFTDAVTDEQVGKICDLLNEQQTTISQLKKEKEYWKSKAMTLLMQVRRLTPRMTDKEVKEFAKELE